MTMQIQTLIQEIRTLLRDAFARVDTWFDQPVEVQNFQPPNGGWTVAEILEHISLTNFFLLKLIDKGAEKALKNAGNFDLAEALQDYHFNRDKLDEIGIHKSFSWVRPEHMEPTGEKPLPEVRSLLQQQLSRCLQHLDDLPNGEGILHKTTMTVNDLGKIDVYHYLYFLAKHAERHLTQMERNLAENHFFKTASSDEF
jgi:hypothetical protein